MLSICACLVDVTCLDYIYIENYLVTTSTCISQLYVERYIKYSGAISTSSQDSLVKTTLKDFFKNILSRFSEYLYAFQILVVTNKG